MTVGQIAGLGILLSPMWVPATFLGVRGVSAVAKTLLATGLVVYASIAIWIAVSRPAALGPLVLVVLAGWALMVWRARPMAGRRRGLPPGSLSLRSSIRALRDYRFYAKQASRFGPVFKTSQYHRPVLCIVGLERCQRFLRENREALTSAALPIDRYVTGGLLRYMDAANHALYRRRLQSCMKPGVLAGCEGLIEERTRIEFEDVAAQCARSPGGGVRPYGAVDRLLFVVLSRVFFNIEPDDPAIPELRRLYGVVDHRRIWRRGNRTREAMTGIVNLVRDRAERIAHNGSETPTSYLGQAIQDDPRLLSDPVFVENLVLFLNIARFDLAGLCAWLLKMVGDHPDWGLRVRSARDATPSSEPTGLGARFVDETLRLRQSEYLYRTTSDPVRFDGYSIPAGWLVRLCIRESHTSEDAFERPHEFDADRFLGKTFSAERYQPFGVYEHTCLGIGITRTIGRIFVEQLTTGFDWSIARDGPMELAPYHHRHWTPSRRFEIRLTPRTV